MKSNKTARPRWLVTGILLTIALQTGVLAVEYLSSVAPLWFGQPVMLPTEPYDPRSLFRGNYVRLNYSISRVPTDIADGKFKDGQKVYLTLNMGGQQPMPVKLSATKPGEGTFICGRIRFVSSEYYRLDYGIEAFFLPKEKALAAERKLTSDKVSAQVYLSSDGKAALNALYCNGEPCDLSEESGD